MSAVSMQSFISTPSLLKRCQTVAKESLRAGLLCACLPLASQAANPAQPDAQAPEVRTSSIDDYRFDATRAPTGKVVHYLKSNLDGSQRVVVSVQFAEALKLEVLKVEHDGASLALVQAELDPVTLTPSVMRSFNRLESGEPQLQMALRSEAGSRKLVAYVAKAELPATVLHLPAHLYNFDLMSLNASLPHLRDHRRDFEVGIVDPDFAFLSRHFRPDGGVQHGGFVFKGRASFRFVGEEVIRKVPCLRYEVSGPAFGNVPGTLWINAADHLIERFEHSLPDNPAWNSLRLERLGARSMSAAEWSAFKDATVLRARQLAGGR